MVFIIMINICMLLYTERHSMFIIQMYLVQELWLLAQALYKIFFIAHLHSISYSTSVQILIYISIYYIYYICVYIYYI